ncbi:MAG: serine--tRNA ligase, partial [Actinobacteria bacterium]|nr:serine--tRNA ligase [Actinomycetota bacterium]
MIDLKLLRDDPERVRKAYARRGGIEGLDGVLDLDRRYLDLLRRVEALRAEQNVASKAIGQASPDQRPAAIEEAKELSDRLKQLEPELEAVEGELQEALAYLPNLPDESVPDGLTEDDNVVEREVGERPGFDFEPLDHVTLGERLGIFDSERGAKTSGSRFVYLTGPGVILEMALVRFAIDFLGERGFTPVIPPVLVRQQAMFGTGFLPTEEHEFYRSERDDLYLVGTSEVPLAAMHEDEVLPADRLPRRYAGYSPCFRREAGTYGKDTKGLVRVHQFDKVE